MRLGIDASNIRAGGGVTHLAQLLRAGQPAVYGFEQVTVWGAASTLARFDDHSWLEKAHDKLLERALPSRLYWQRFRIDAVVRSEACDLLFVPGGLYSGNMRPFVTMSHNMLPFEPEEQKRFGYSFPSIRYRLLRKSLLATFRKANGLIFLSNYARTAIEPYLRAENVATTTIPHGIEDVYRCKPRVQRNLRSYSSQSPFRLLYVSIINLYKHQWKVAEAISELRSEGFPVSIDFVGPAYGPALQKLQRTQAELDPDGEFIRYVGFVDHSELPDVYHQAHGFVFGSSCENMPNILLEAMASGLPIACSNRGPMPEVLRDAGIYFDPEDSREIANSLRIMLNDHGLRGRLAAAAYENAHDYTWQRCADETFRFFAIVAQESK